jgi:hypothetical protein
MTTLLRSDAGAPDGADLPPDAAAWIEVQPL